jgi:hypothetical protein
MMQQALQDFEIGQWKSVSHSIRYVGAKCQPGWEMTLLCRGCGSRLMLDGTDNRVNKFSQTIENDMVYTLGRMEATEIVPRGCPDGHGVNFVEIEQEIRKRFAGFSSKPDYREIERSILERERRRAPEPDEQRVFGLAAWDVTSDPIEIDAVLSAATAKKPRAPKKPSVPAKPKPNATVLILKPGQRKLKL